MATGVPGSQPMPPTMQGGAAGNQNDFLRRQALGQPGPSPQFRPPSMSPADAGGGMAPPIRPPSMAPPLVPPGGGPTSGGVGGAPQQAPVPQPKPPMGGGMVDAGYGQGPLNAQGQQAPMGSPPIMAPPAPSPLVTQNQNKMQTHNPTGVGTQQASEKAAVMRPTPATAPKAQGIMGPPTPQKAGTGKK